MNIYKLKLYLKARYLLIFPTLSAVFYANTFNGYDCCFRRLPAPCCPCASDVHISPFGWYSVKTSTEKRSMENVSNRLELLTGNDGHAVMQTTCARMRDVRASATSHQRPPGLPGGVIRGGGLLMEAQIDSAVYLGLHGLLHSC